MKNELEQAREAAAIKTAIQQYKDENLDNPNSALPTGVRITLTEGIKLGYKAAQPQWVRVNDRLPTKDGEYLVTASNGDYFVDGATFQNDWFQYGDVIAWMPLPEPFMGGE